MILNYFCFLPKVSKQMKEFGTCSFFYLQNTLHKPLHKAESELPAIHIY